MNTDQSTDSASSDDRYTSNFTQRRVESDGHIHWITHRDNKPWTVHTTVLSTQSQEYLGLVAYWASWLELHLEWALHDLIGELPNTDLARVLTQDLSASQIIARIRRYLSVAEIDSPHAQSSLDAASRALQKRNRVLHGAMGGHLAPDTASLSSRRKSETSSISSQEMAAVAEQVFDASMTITSVRWDLLGEDIRRSRENFPY